MGPQANDGDFSAGFVEALQWLVWNEVWQKANAILAARSVSAVRDKKQKDARDNADRAKKHLKVAVGSEELPEPVIEALCELARLAGEESARAHVKKEQVSPKAFTDKEPPAAADHELWLKLVSAVHVAAVTVQEGLANHQSENYTRLEAEYASAWHWLSCPRWHLQPLKDMGEIGRALFACAPLYSHVQYFARLAQWLTWRGHKVRLVTVTSEPARKAAAQARLPEGTLELLPASGMYSGFVDIWTELSLQGTLSGAAEVRWDKSLKYLQTAAAKSIAKFKPDLVVSDGMSEPEFLESCKTHARRAAALICHARKDGVDDDRGPERLPTLYPTVGALFDERHKFQSTVLCGPFLPHSLRKTTVLREGGEELRAWCEADDRPLIYVSFGTVAALKPDFVGRFARALLDFCRGPRLRAGAPAQAPGGLPVLEVGDGVRITGLTKNPQLNGQRGTLASEDEATGRWTVKLESGEKAIKPDNLERVVDAWLQLQDTWCFSDEYTDGGKCKGTPEELRKLRERCQARGHGGFAVSEGVAYLFPAKPEELLEHAEASAGSVLHFSVRAAPVPRDRPPASEEPPPASEPVNSQKARWDCPNCGEPNRSDRQVCNTCGRARPSTEAAAGTAEAAGEASEDAAAAAGAGSSSVWCKVLWALPKEHQKLLPVQARAPRPHFRVEEFVPQQAVLRLQRTVLCISHCGANSTHESLACGVPMLCVPFFRDQYDWSRAVVRRRAGVPLDCRSCGEDDIREAAALALSPTYAGGAQDLSKSILEHLSGKPGLVRAGHFCLSGMLNRG